MKFGSIKTGRKDFEDDCGSRRRGNSVVLWTPRPLARSRRWRCCASAGKSTRTLRGGARCWAILTNQIVDQFFNRGEFAGPTLGEGCWSGAAAGCKAQVECEGSWGP